MVALLAGRVGISAVSMSARYTTCFYHNRPPGFEAFFFFETRSFPLVLLVVGPGPDGDAKKSKQAKRLALAVMHQKTKQRELLCCVMFLLRFDSVALDVVWRS